MTWLYGVATNMMPLLTRSGAWCPESTPVENAQAGASFFTLRMLI